MTNLNVLEATVSHTYAASMDKVFNAWVDPEMVGKWMFGPAIRDEEVVSIEIDAKVGGAFSFLVKRDVTVIDHIGIYTRIERPRHLEFNWGVKGMKDSSRVIVALEPHDKGCTLNLIHELHPSWEAYLQRSIDGWAEMLRALEKALK